METLQTALPAEEKSDQRHPHSTEGEKHLKSLTVLIYPQKLFPFNLRAGITTKKRLHPSSEYGPGK